jgi:hypothetical protein
MRPTLSTDVLQFWAYCTTILTGIFYVVGGIANFPPGPPDLHPITIGIKLMMGFMLLVFGTLLWMFVMIAVAWTRSNDQIEGREHRVRFRLWVMMAVAAAVAVALLAAMTFMAGRFAGHYIIGLFVFLVILYLVDVVNGRVSQL